MIIAPKQTPPGLNEFCENNEVSEEEKEALAQMWDTTRGTRDFTQTMWKLYLNALRKFKENNE